MYVLVGIPLPTPWIFFNIYERRFPSSCILCLASTDWVVFRSLTCVLYLGYVSSIEWIPGYKISFFPTFLHVSISSFIFLVYDRWVDGQTVKFHIDFSFRYTGTLVVNRKRRCLVELSVGARSESSGDCNQWLVSRSISAAFILWVSTCSAISGLPSKS